MPAAENRHLGQDDEACPDAFYVRRGEHRFISTLHSQGAWQPGEQHLAPASGLLLAEVERRLPGDKAVSRASFDVLGVIQSGECTIDLQVIRPGRTIELVEASMRHGERTSIRARIWRLAGTDTARVQGIEWDALPAPADMQALSMSAIWDGGFVASLEVRQAADARPGRGRS